MDVVVLETHGADGGDDYEVNAALPWRFIFRLSCCGQDIRTGGAGHQEGGAGHQDGGGISVGHAASTFSRSIMSSIFPPL